MGQKHLKLNHGCHLVSSLNSLLHYRSLLTGSGLEIIRVAIQNSIHPRNLDVWGRWLGAYGPDCHAVELRLGGPTGPRFVFTNDAANIKALLATQFEDYGKGKRFHDDWEPFLGDGIFTADAEAWRTSRQLIRTQFLKERVSDLGIFEKHTQILIGIITKHGLGKEIDMFRMFQRYTLDAATEFLFGRSVDNLNNPAAGFAEAFADVQAILNFRGNLG
jgi:cytochrome P450